MGPTAFTLAAIAAFLLAVTAAHWFKSLGFELWRDAMTPLVAGLICGAILRFTTTNAIVVGILLTVAALYVRLTGRESEAADGMVLGALTGAAAAIPLMAHLAECILAGAVAGYGITFALTHVRDKMRQFVVDAITAAAAIGAAYVPTLVARTGLAPRWIDVAVVAAIPLLVVITVFKQSTSIRAELRHEASLGVIDDADVRPTAHPLLRIGRGGWHDAEAHREFVRVASKIALRKRQQRYRPDDTARLYQVEIIKLRMQVQEMSRIDRAMRSHAETVQLNRE